MSTLQQQARALGDPTRYEIFRHIAEAGGPVAVAALTDHVGVNHNAVRQHLAKLVEAGLVMETRLATGRRGRPPLAYAVAPGADSRWGVTGPYERLSHLLAEVVRTGEAPIEVGRRAGHRARGSTLLADGVSEITDAMAREGFEPEVRRRGDRVEVVLHTCPYASTALTDPTTVCALHLGMAQGVAEGTDTAVSDLIPHDPRRAGCRLLLRPGARTSSG